MNGRTSEVQGVRQPTSTRALWLHNLARVFAPPFILARAPPLPLSLPLALASPTMASGPLRAVFETVPFTNAGCFACPPLLTEPTAYFSAPLGSSTIGLMTLLYPDRCAAGCREDLLFSACVGDSAMYGLLLVDEEGRSVEFFDRAIFGPSVTQEYLDSWVAAYHTPGLHLLPALAIYTASYTADAVIAKDCIENGFLVQNGPRTPIATVARLQQAGVLVGAAVVDSVPLDSDPLAVAVMLRRGYMPALTKVMADGTIVCVPRTAFNTGIDWSLCLLAAGYLRAGFERSMVLLEPAFVQAVRSSHLGHLARQQTLFESGPISLFDAPAPATEAPMLDAGEMVPAGTALMLIENLLSEDIEATLDVLLRHMDDDF